MIQFGCGSQRIRTEDRRPDDRTESSTHVLGLHLPHRVDPEVSEEGVVRGMPGGVERDLAAIVGYEEDRDSGRVDQQGSHLLEREDTAERIGVENHGVSEGEKCPDAV